MRSGCFLGEAFSHCISQQRVLSYGFPLPLGGESSPWSEDKDSHICGDRRAGRTRRKGGLLGRPWEGRKRNLLWVVEATYGRSVRRPTVGFFGDLPWIVFLPLGAGEAGGVGEGA